MRTTNRHRDVGSRTDSLAFGAVVVGILSVVAALGIGWASYHTSITTIERRYQAFYLQKAHMLATLAEQHSGASDGDLLRLIDATWRSGHDTPTDEYICIIDKDSRLILHTAHPNRVGSNAGDNMLLGSDNRPACRLRDLSDGSDTYLGDYISSEGETQLAAFHPISERRWVLGVHRSKAALHGEIRADVLSLAGGFLLVCGLLLPLSLLLLYRSSRLSLQISERARANLYSSEERYRAIAEDTPVLICRFESGGVITYVNETYCRYFEKAFDDLVGQSFLSVIPEADRKAVMANITSMTVDSPTKSHEHQAIAADGNIRWQRWTIRALFDAEGKAVAYQSIGEDITERKHAREALRESEEHVRLLLDSTAEAIYGLDLDGNCTWCNRACIQMLGYGSSNRLLGKNMHDLTHHTRADGSPYPMKQSRIYEAFRRGEGTHVDDEVLWRADGTSFPAEYWSYPIRHDGEVVGSVVTFLDITERKQAQVTVTRFSRMIESSLNEIYIFDAQSLNFIEVNRGARENLGYTIEELRSLTPLDLKPEFTAETFAELVQPLRTGDREAIQFNTVHHRKDGSRYPIEVSLQLMTDDPPIFVAIILDITERKRADEAARRARDELLAQREREKELVEAELAKVRDELIRGARLATIGQMAASIAHELRNPLGAVRNAAYYLKRHVPSDNPKLPEYLDIIDQEVSAADRVIRDMMEMARSKEPVKEKVDLGPMLRGILERIHPSGAVRCDASLEPDPFLVNADPGQLQQVMTNILLNAIQVMEGKGEITVAARRNADYDIISVQDSGPGVAAEDRDRVFEPLFTTKAKGTGLGLAICRQIIERHGGSVDLLDDGTTGATFRIRLPH